MSVKTVAFLGAALLIGVAFHLAPATAGDDDGPESAIGRIVAFMAGVKVEITEAVEIAEAKVEGRAMAVGPDVEDGKPAFEVHLLVVGDHPRLVEVVVDARTGEVLDVDGLGPDDDDDEDDDEDDDDDDEDDDDEDDDD